MRLNSVFVIAGICVALVLTACTTLFAQDSQSVPYQGQNTKRFQMFFSPIARADTFMIDTTTANLWQLVKAENGNTIFQSTTVLGNPAKGSIGRYILYFGSKVRADTFIVDTEQGYIWQLFTDPETNTIFFNRVTVEGIYING